MGNIFNSHPVFFFALLGLFVLFLAVVAWRREKKRREAFQRLALQLGLKYVREDSSIPRKYSFLDALCRGESRRAFNVLRGNYNGHPVQVFDYRYVTRDSDDDKKTHHFSYFILEQEKIFPELRIYPETFMSKLGQMIGFDDIDFESLEFSKAFTVRSSDKKFAYDVCHARMMDYLLNHRNLSIEIENNCVALSFATRLKLAEIPGRLNQLTEIRDLFPEYLYRD